MLYYIHLSGQPDRIKRSIRIELPKVNCSEYKQEGVFMQKTEYGYRRAIRIGIICLIFALCMGEYAFGSVVVDEVLIGGQEEQAPVDAAPAAGIGRTGCVTARVGGTNKTGITVNNGTASKN